MPYVIFTANKADGQELDRCALSDQPLIVGRSPECNVPIHDILLSRRHCRIEQTGGKWKVIDLQSKNGTFFNWVRIAERVLNEGDQLRVGRTWITFRSGPYQSAGEAPRRGNIVRPADPFEALNGTVSDFVLEPLDEQEENSNDPVSAPSSGADATPESDRGEAIDFDVCPSSPVRAADPHESSVHETTPLDDPLLELSSSWHSMNGSSDSATGTATAMVLARPRVLEGARLRVRPRVRVQASEPRVRHAAPVCLSLQAKPELLRKPARHLAELAQIAPIDLIQRADRKARLALRTAVAALIFAGSGMFLMCAWLLLQK